MLGVWVWMVCGALGGAPARAADAAVVVPSSALLERLGQLVPNPRMRGAREQALYAQVAPGVLLVWALDDAGELRGQGSAVILEGGWVLTNQHVIGDADQALGLFFRPPNEPAAVGVSLRPVWQDRERDLAFLKMDAPLPAGVGALSLAETDPAVGADLLAIGHPDGERWTLSEGMLEHVGTGLPERSADVAILRSKGLLLPGMSGGPFVDEEGRVVGLATLTRTTENGVVLDYAVAASAIREALEEAKAAPPQGRTLAMSRVEPLSDEASRRIQQVFGKEIKFSSPLMQVVTGSLAYMLVDMTGDGQWDIIW